MLNSKKLLAAAAAGFMTVSTFGLTVSAADGVSDHIKNPSIPVTKDVTDMGKDSRLPSAPLTFTISNSSVRGTIEGQSIKESNPAGLLLFNNGSVTTTLSPNEDLQSYESTTLNVNQDAEGVTPGIYAYTITETTTLNDGAFEGMTATTASFEVLVHVYNDNTAVITAYKTLTPGANGVINVNQGKEKVEFVNKYQTSTLTLIKKVDGNQSVATDKFEFTITLEPNAKTDNLTVSTNGGETWEKLTIGEDGKIVLPKVELDAVEGNNSSKIMIGGLTASDKYTIVEDSDGENGYTATVTTNPQNPIETNTVTGTAQATNNKNEEFTNVKEGTIPTGIIMSAAPFAGMIGLGGIFAGLFFRKKRED